MGYIHIEWARDQDLNHTEKMVLYTLTLRASNTTRQTFMSVGTIAREGGFSPKSRNSIRRALVNLKAKNLIDWKGQVREGTAEQSSNIYTINWNEVGAESTNVGAENTNLGAESTTNRVLNQVPNKSIDSPTSSDAAIDSPRTSASTSNTIAEKADPIGPDWYNSEERKDALDYMQTLAKFRVQGKDDDYYNNVHVLADHLNKHLHSGYEGFDLLYDYWDIPKDCALDRGKAAAKLNQLIGTVKRDDGPLAYRPLERA